MLLPKKNIINCIKSNKKKELVFFRFYTFSSIQEIKTLKQISGENNFSGAFTPLKNWMALFMQIYGDINCIVQNMMGP